MNNNVSTDGATLLQEAFDLIGFTTLSGVFYGIAFVLYCLCARLWYLQLRRDPHHRRYTMLSLTLASIVIMSATAAMAVGTRIAQLAYVDHSGFPGGPPNYEDSVILAPDNPLRAAYIILTLIADASTQGVQVWRLWNVWRSTRAYVIVMVPPLVLLFVYVGLSLMIFALPLSSNLLAPISVATLSLNSFFIILVTTMISTRLMLVRRCHLKAMGTVMSEFADQYLGIVAMLIESYALESVWAIANLVSYTSSGSCFFLFNETNDQVKVIAYLLISYRVASGRAWSPETERQLSSLRWDGGAQSTRTETLTSRPTGAPENNMTLAERPRHAPRPDV